MKATLKMLQMRLQRITIMNFAQLQSLQEIVSSSVEGSFTILGGIEGINYTYNGAEVVIKNGADLTIFNTNSDTEIFDTNTSIIIANNANAKLTLAGVRISLNSNSPIAVRDGAQLTLTLQENTVNQLSNNSGCGIELQVPPHLSLKERFLNL